MTADECIDAAFAALSRGDLAERDRLCAAALNLIGTTQLVPRDLAAQNKAPPSQGPIGVT